MDNNIHASKPNIEGSCLTVSISDDLWRRVNSSVTVRNRALKQCYPFGLLSHGVSNGFHYHLLTPALWASRRSRFTGFPQLQQMEVALEYTHDR